MSKCVIGSSEFGSSGDNRKRCIWRLADEPTLAKPSAESYPDPGSRSRIFDRAERSTPCTLVAGQTNKQTHVSLVSIDESIIRYSLFCTALRIGVSGLTLAVWRLRVDVYGLPDMTRGGIFWNESKSNWIELFNYLLHAYWLARCTGI